MLRKRNETNKSKILRSRENNIQLGETARTSSFGELASCVIGVQVHECMEGRKFLDSDEVNFQNKLKLLNPHNDEEVVYETPR